MKRRRKWRRKKERKKYTHRALPHCDDGVANPNANVVILYIEHGE